MSKPKFQEIWKWGIITFLTVSLGLAMNDLELLGMQKYVIVVYFALAFFISLAIVQMLWTVTPKFLHFLETPKGKNLRIYPGSLYDNIFTLKFLDTEWRHLFKITTAFVNIERFVFVEGIGDQNEKLEWRNQKNAQLDIKRFVPYEINFLQINPEENEFSVKAKAGQFFKFPPGKWGFMIKLTSNIIGNFRVRNNSLLDKLNFRSAFQPVYLIVNYQGKKKISVTTVTRQEYEKHIWHKKIDWEEREKKPRDNIV